MLSTARGFLHVPVILRKRSIHKEHGKKTLRNRTLLGPCAKQDLNLLKKKTYRDYIKAKVCYLGTWTLKGNLTS